MASRVWPFIPRRMDPAAVWPRLWVVALKNELIEREVVGNPTADLDVPDPSDLEVDGLATNVLRLV